MMVENGRHIEIGRMAIVLNIEALAIVLLGTAFIVACYARLPWRWTQFIVPMLLGWIPAAIFGLWLLGDGSRWFQHALPKYFRVMPTLTAHWFTAACGLAVGLVVLPMIGLWRRRTGGSRVPIAATWPILKLFFGAILSGVLLAVTIFAADVHMRGRIAEQLELGRATLTRLRPEPVPAEEDAAPLLKEAIALLGDEKSMPEWWKETRQSGFDVTQPGVGEFLQAHSRSIELALEASKRPVAHFIWVDNDPAKVDDDAELASCFRVRMLLQLAAQWRASMNDETGCLECLEALRRLARQRVSPPTIIRSISSQAYDTSRLDAIEAILAAGPLACDKFSTIEPNDPFTHRATMRRAIELQSTKEMEVVCRSAMGEIDDWIYDGQPPRRWMRPLELAIQRVFITPDDLDGLPELIRLAQTSLDDRSPGALEELDHRWENGTRGMACNIAVFLYGTTCRQPFKADRAARLADVGLAIVAYQSKHKKMPEKLANLIPEFMTSIPVDPFDDQPLKMTPDNGGFVVHGGRFEDIEFDRDPVLCLGPAYQKRKVEPARENPER